MTFAEIVAANRRGFSNVMRFEGRDRPRQFWPYMLFLYAASTLAGLAITLPMLVSIFTETFATISQGAAQDPEALQAQMMQSVMEQTRGLLPMSFAINALFIGLVASAVARRLHDRDWSGWWVLILPVTAIVGAIASWWLFEAIADHPQMMIDQPQLFQLAGWLPMIGYIILIVQLVQSGDPRTNRFGDPPD